MAFSRVNQLFLLPLCYSHGVIAIQEHWLTDYNLDKKLNFHIDFYRCGKISYDRKKYNQVFYVGIHLVELQ